MKIRINLFLFSSTIIILAITFSTLLFLAQMHADTLKWAATEQEQAIRTFWQLLRAKGNDFRVVNGRMMVGDYVVNGNFELPDKIRETFGGTATIFMGDTRVSTNVLKEDGTRAVGTKLQGPAYDAIFRNNRSYRGEVPILGIPYFTAYDPIRDASGRTIGVLYVGSKKSEFLSSYNQRKIEIVAGTSLLGILLIALALGLLRERGWTEAQIRKMADQTRLITDSVPAAIAYVDAGLHYQFANRRYHELFAGKLDELIGKTVKDILGEALLAARQENIDQVLAGNEVVFASQITQRDGSIVHLQTSFIPHQLKNGEVIGFFIQHYDITALTLTQEALRTSGERYRILFNTTGAMTFVVEEDTTIALANEEFIRYSGWSREEVEGRLSWTDFVTPESRERMLGYHQDRRRDPASAPKSYECEVAWRDGSLRNMIVHVNIIPGTRQSIVSFLDITTLKQLEASLQSQLTLLQTLIDTIPNPIYYKDRTGCYLGCNLAFQQNLGLARDQLIGKTVYDIAPPELADTYFAMDEALFSNPGTQINESSIINADGSQHDVVFHKATFTGKDGLVGGIVGVILDITERKQAADVLAEKENFLANIFDCIQDGVCIFDDELRIIRANPVIQQRFAGNGPLTGRKCHEAFHGSQEPCDLCPSLETLQSGKPSFKVLSRNDNGAEIWLELYTFPLFDAEKSRITGVIEYTRDVTERKRAEEALVATEKKFRCLVEQSLVGTYIIMEGRFIYVNPKMAEIFGYSETELTSGITHLDLTAEQDRWLTAENVRKRTAGEIQSINYVFTGLRKDGTEINVEVYGTVTEYNGKPAIIGTLLDVTASRLAGKALRESEARYRVVFENSGSAMIISENDTTISLANRKFLELTGLAMEEIEGRKSWGEFIDPADRERMLSYHRLHRIDPEAAPSSYEFRLVDRAGTVKDILATVAVLPGTDKSIQSYLNISELKLSERLLAGEKLVMEMIVRGTPLPEVLAAICANIEGVSPGGLCSLLLLDDDGRHLRHAAAPTLPEAYCKAIDGTRIGQGIGSCGTAAFSGKQVIVADIATDPLWAKYRKLPLSFGLQSCWSQPIMASSGAILGTFAVYYTEPRMPSPDELLRVERAAHLASIVIERKRAAESLRQIQLRKQAMLDNIPDLVWLKDLDCRYVSANKAYTDACRTTPEELTGKTDLDIWPLDLAEKYQSDDAQVMQSGKQIRMEELLARENGTRKWVETIKMPVYDRQGEVIGTTGIARDIEARKFADEALRESEDRFHRIFSQSDDAVLLFRMDDFALIDVNPAALALFDYERSELLGLKASILIARSDFEALVEVIPRSNPSEVFQLDQAYGIRRDGRQLMIVIRCKILTLREEYVIHCSIRDITEKMQLEEVVRNTQAKLIHTNKMTSIGMLASSVAHEINNPNNCISVNAAMLADVWQDAEPLLETVRKEQGEFMLRGIPFTKMQEFAPRLLAGIKEGSRRITAIVQNMRDYVLEDKNGHQGAVDINQLLQNAMSILWHHIHIQTDHFNTDQAEGLPLTRGNGQQLEQVFINLITNALQALPDKKAGVFVTTSMGKGESITIEVRDEGRGMDETTLARLTEPFFTTRTGEGGTGLGLYISDSIIKEHGGTLEFRSEPGKGTTATVRLSVAG